MAHLSKRQIERRVDAAMNAASRGLQIPLSKLGDMWKATSYVLIGRPDQDDADLAGAARQVMIAMGATEVA